MTANTEHGYVPQWLIGDRLRKIRLEAGMKQADFSNALGVNANTYSAWETGRNTPSYEEVLVIAKKIQLMRGIPQWWTLGAENPRPGDPDGGMVRHQGLEPRTRWYIDNRGLTSNVLDVDFSPAARGLHPQGCAAADVDLDFAAAA